MSNMTNEIRKRLCKLCLETSDEQIGILSDEGRLLNIDSTLGQHFRFKFDTAKSNSICYKCWLKVKTFHAFYLRIENLHGNSSSWKLVDANLSGKKGENHVVIGKVKNCSKTTKSTERVEFQCMTRTKRRRNMDGNIPYVIEMDGKVNEHYWEDVNDVMSSTIDTAYLPSEDAEAEKRIEVQTIQATLFEDFKDDDEGDDDALIIFKEKTVKRSGEITAKILAHQVEAADNCNGRNKAASYASSKRSEVEDIETTIAPSVIIGIGTNNEEDSFREKNVQKYRRKRKPLLSEYPLTPEIMEELRKRLNVGIFTEPAAVDCQQIQRYMDLSCIICREPFRSFAASHQHFLDVHQRNAIWKCCNLQLDTIYDISDHIKYHENPNEFSCAACPRRFNMRNKLRHHIRRFHLPERNNLQCDICQQVLPSQKSYLIHERRHITYKCPFCDRTINAQNAERHIKFAHTASEKVMCDYCGKVSCDRKAYHLHYLVEHSGVDQKLQCDICGLWAKHRKQLGKHMRKHFHAPQTCNVCGKITPNKYALSSHMSTHKERKHKCRFCDKVYLKRKMLEEHESIHTGIKDLYHCDFCDRTFRFNSGMYAHRKKAHPVEYQQMQKKSYLEVGSSSCTNTSITNL